AHYTIRPRASRRVLNSELIVEAEHPIRLSLARRTDPGRPRPKPIPLSQEVPHAPFRARYLSRTLEHGSAGDARAASRPAQGQVRLPARSRRALRGRALLASRGDRWLHHKGV